MTNTLAMPSSTNGTVVAVLTFYSREPAAYTETHRRIAESVAEIVAVAHRAAPSMPMAAAA